jgi:hypothetical protein
MKVAHGITRVVGLELLEVTEQRVHRRVPGLVRRHVGELVRPGHVARSVDVGVDRLQVLVGLHRAIGRNAQVFQAIAGQARDAAYRAEQLVERDAFFGACVFHHQRLLAIDDFAAQRLVPGQHRHAVGFQRGLGQRAHFFVFPHHDARAHLHLRDLRTQACKALRQFRTDGPAAQHHQAPGHFVELGELVPQGVAGDVADVVESRQRRHEGPRTGCDHDAARGQALRATAVQRLISTVHGFTSLA